MKVAYLGIKGIPAKGGTERVVEAIATRVQSHGIEPTVYCERGYSPSNADVPGVRLIHLPSLPGKYFRALSLDLFAALHALFRGDYDLIHLHNSEASFVLPLLRLRYKVLATHHGSAYWRAKWGAVAKRILQITDYPFMYLSNAVTSVSEKDSQELTSRFGREVAYIPNGVGLEYHPDFEAARAILDSHGLEPGSYLLFVAGRIEPTKGADLAIEAVNRLGHLAPPLLVVGDDSHVPSYRQQLRELAGPGVHFQQFVDGTGTLFGLMASARCLIFPSLVEAMSMVLLEAASVGVPILCSDIPENRAVMKDDTAYFASNDCTALTERLHWALENPEEMTRLSQAAMARIRVDHDWDSLVSRYVAIYQTLGKRSSSASWSVEKI